MSENKKLKPCPFCGNEDVYIVNFRRNKGGKDWRVLCDECFAMVDFTQCRDGHDVFLTKEQTIAVWNGRPGNE